jgi:hypothetical protein
MDRTKDPAFRRGRKRLFVSIMEGFEREIRPATVARWIVYTIQLADSLTNTSPNLRRRRRSPPMRCVLCLPPGQPIREVALGDVLEAATLSNHSSFPQFYLWDCSILADGMQSIGPVVAAHHLV